MLYLQCLNLKVLRIKTLKYIEKKNPINIKAFV